MMLGHMSVRDTSVPNPFVGENVYLKLLADRLPLPTFANAKERLPSPFWEGHTPVIDCYWKAWELAFKNLRQPPEGSPLIANFIDTAFNDATFMWDSAFMSMFGRYGHRVFNFQRTLDNFYARQHRDGFISRQIKVEDGTEAFERYDLASTGPNVMPWAEWEYYLNFGDRERLAKVFPPLVAYTQWFQKFRTWPDGTYFSNGWGCGMDNQPRLPKGCNHMFEHGHMTWIDTTLQQILSDRLLLKMADELGRTAELEDLRTELEMLSQFVNAHLWDDAHGFYFDRFRDGSRSTVKSIGAYWALLAEVVSSENVEKFVSHLTNAREFNRPHRVPSLSADHTDYDPQGGYWRGGVWAPSNYMVLRGLTHVGKDALAHKIALNHLQNVTEVFQKTGTVWENYAPEFAAPGKPAKRDFVGWTGLSPIAVLLEYGFGLRPDASRHALLWDVRLLKSHGVENYPLGADTLLNLRCAARGSITAEPSVEVSANQPVTLTLRWDGGEKTLHIQP